MYRAITADQLETLLQGCEQENIIFLRGRAYVVRLASPDDVERIGKGFAVEDEGDA